MRITNELNLPTAFVKLAERDYIFKDKEYRVTSLLKGIRETVLERRHHDKIERDAADMIWLVFGTAVHSILESQQETDTELKEERIKIPIGDYILSGQFDLYCDKEKKITDYKTASVWKIIYGDFEDWRKQEMIYAYMIQQLGFNVRKGEIVALLKDHSKSKAKYDPSYPQQPVASVAFDITAKDMTDTELFLKYKFIEIEKAEKMADDELPVCTPEERWNSGDKYAVMKKGRKSALRVLDSQDDAAKWMIDNGKGEYIETRPGEDRKCQDYCNVNMFCSYWQEVQNEHN